LPNFLSESSKCDEIMKNALDDIENEHGLKNYFERVLNILKNNI
jgi:predicted small metal-binding protein